MTPGSGRPPAMPSIQAAASADSGSDFQVGGQPEPGHGHVATQAGIVGLGVVMSWGDRAAPACRAGGLRLTVARRRALGLRDADPMPAQRRSLCFSHGACAWCLTVRTLSINSWD